MSLTAGRLIKQACVLLDRQTASRTAKLCNYHQFSRKPISSCLETSSYFKGLQHRAYCQVGDTTAKKLQAEGFSQQQAECLTKVMSDLLSNALEKSDKKLEGLVKIDIDLEKSRAIEEHANNQKDLQSLANRLDVIDANAANNWKVLDSIMYVRRSNWNAQQDKNITESKRYSVGLVTTALLIIMAIIKYTRPSKHTTTST